MLLCYCENRVIRLGFIMKNLFVTCPHSGEKIAPETTWLQGLPVLVQLRDLDRFVDIFYKDFCTEHQIDFISTEWSRYVIDLNRELTDIDQKAVSSEILPKDKYPRGLHWRVTTLGEILLPKAMTLKEHKLLVEKYYNFFHDAIQRKYLDFKKNGPVYQLDVHSMPSVGTALHSDSGKTRADIVISDYHGSSCSSWYKDLVMESYAKVGFDVAYNDPYVGGGITRMYGKPKEGLHCIQVELNRKLYMDEATKDLLDDRAKEVKNKIEVALTNIYENL